MIKGGLIQRPDSNQIITLQNWIPAVEHLALRGAIHADSQPRVLAEGRGAWDAEEVAVEVDGGGERRSDIEDRGKGEKRYGATVAIRHDALDRAVVSDATVAQLHRLDNKLYPRRFGGL